MNRTAIDTCRAVAAAALLTLSFTSPLSAQTGPRARDLGVPFDGTPGLHNAITDVAGVEVGHTTLISGSGKLVVGEGPVRTGVTAILPRGKESPDPVFAAWFPLNGNGEMTGTTWIDESGFLEGPVLITNTHSVGVVRDAVIRWRRERGHDFLWALPVVAETWDGLLNDLDGFHVEPAHVFQALDSAMGGPVEEGAVGGGTGMVCNGFKGGIGTSSRKLSPEAGGYTVGVLVQCNYGGREILRIAGVPVGREIEGLETCRASDVESTRVWLDDLPRCEEEGAGESDEAPGSDEVPGSDEAPDTGRGSIIIVVATDAPLLPHQLERIVKRATLGIGREGSIASHYSGDIFVAFSTANPGATSAGESGTVPLAMLPNERLGPLFAATVQATEEAVTNAMVAARTMTGAGDVRVYALPHDRLREILGRYNRLADMQ
ncbi:MAG: P1 family peptidase [Gemmatimonadota bacterium]